MAAGTATPTAGPAPLSVAFSAAGSSDPDGDPLTFAWAFGDGGTASGISTNHTYASVGSYTATVTVSDGRGGSAVKSFAITVGIPPTATISQPAAGTLYSAGDTVAFSGTATDASGATLPASAFSWTVLFHHDAHTHPALGPLNGVRSGSFTIPRTGHPEPTVFYRIYLTVTDGSGIQTQVTRDVTPRTVQVTIATNVSGAQILLDGQPQAAPHTFTSVVGVQRTIDVSSPQSIAGQSYAFGQWSDGGAQSHVITAPLTNQTYTATLTAGPPPDGRPRNLTSVVAKTSVTLTWEAPLNSPQPVTGYALEAGISPGSPVWSAPVGNVLTVSTTAPSGVYYVRVRALTASGPSAPSNEIAVATGQAAPPLAPLGLLATVQGTNVAFQWRENPLGPEVAQYQFHAGTGPGLSNLVRRAAAIDHDVGRDVGAGWDLLRAHEGGQCERRGPGLQRGDGHARPGDLHGAGGADGFDGGTSGGRPGPALERPIVGGDSDRLSTRSRDVAWRVGYRRPDAAGDDRRRRAGAQRPLFRQARRDERLRQLGGVRRYRLRRSVGRAAAGAPTASARCAGSTARWAGSPPAAPRR